MINTQLKAGLQSFNEALIDLYLKIYDFVIKKYQIADIVSHVGNASGRHLTITRGGKSKRRTYRLKSGTQYLSQPIHPT